MLTHLHMKHFKSWRDSGPIRLAPLTGFFGANSSGKTAILQLLLMLKQTVESADRARVLHTGDERTYVDLGTFVDIVFGHTVPGNLQFELKWRLPTPLTIPDPETGEDLFTITALEFESSNGGDAKKIAVERFSYSFNIGEKRYRFGMERKGGRYSLIAEGHELKRTRGRPRRVLHPVKCYGFPDEVNAQFVNAGFLSDLVLAFEHLFQNIYYLGPLREYPHRSYVWAGERPQDVGIRGELAVPALLAARARGQQVSRGKGRKKQHVDERVAEWLHQLGLIESFELKPVAADRRDYEVRVKQSPGATEVLITDVGFGVSQILPVLTLCYYAPVGSTLILEQPEIHLHPAVQAGLADVFIDAIRHRKIQIILESHSEYLLRRLQRRIAEERLSEKDVSLYFVANPDGTSRLQQLEIDLLGNIRNWPEDFFGDEMGELIAMTEAAMRRSDDGEKARV
ncbi:MAG: DUF3696 domain-containing protein [Caldilineae bacterium]|nr:MAG: DUF3696 domain-containing protein [Caldilineae bacterium]